MNDGSRTRLNLWLTALLGLAIVVLANYLSTRHYKRWDWTQDNLFTLSDRSKETLHALEEDVQIYVFLARGEQDFADIETLLEEYKAVTPRIEVEWIDPDRDRGRYQVLADRFGIDTWLAGDLTLSQVPVVVTSGDRKWKVERHQLIVEDFESFDDVDGHKLDLQSERSLTGAILEVTTGEPTRVCLSRGHGEWEKDSIDERSFDAVARELDWEKIEVEPVEVRRDTEIPDSCNALFIISPQRPFDAQEVAAVDAFVERGGNLLLAFDPVLSKEQLQPTGFEASLSRRGIALGNDLVVENDPSHQLPGNPGDLFLATDLSTHRVTDGIRQRGGGVVFVVARSVDAADNSNAEVLIRTSAAGAVESDLGKMAGGTPRDPSEARVVPVAAAWEYVPPLGEGLEPVEREGPEPGRVLVFGDSDWMTGDLLSNPQLSNIDLVSATAGWLTQREALIEIAPRKTQARAVIMSDSDLANVLFRVVFLLPMAALIAGFGVWWSRRS